MCRDYNPRQSECALALCQLHLSLGQLDLALAELDGVLTQRRADRLMMNNINHWECMVPRIAAELFATKAQSQQQGLSAEEAMYFFLLVIITAVIHTLHYLTFICCICRCRWLRMIFAPDRFPWCCLRPRASSTRQWRAWSRVRDRDNNRKMLLIISL